MSGTNSIEYWVARDRSGALWFFSYEPTMSKHGVWQVRGVLHCARLDGRQFNEVPPGEKHKVKLTIEVI